jgi:phosphatidylserine/phosphatidylglycerophosphate/cardiolipin synthase-like enzyme
LRVVVRYHASIEAVCVDAGLPVNATSTSLRKGSAMIRSTPSVTAMLFVGLSGCLSLPPAVNEEIEDDGSSIDTLLDRYTDSHAIGDSGMELLIDGPASESAFADLIGSAHDHLHIETLNFDDDAAKPRDVAGAFADRLMAAAARGVRVRLILDPLVQGIWGDPSLIGALRTGGVEVRCCMARTRSFLWPTGSRPLSAA